MNILEYIIYIPLIIIGLCSLVYLLSRIQMKGWMHQLDKGLLNTHYKFKNKKDDKNQNKE